VAEIHLKTSRIPGWVGFNRLDVLTLPELVALIVTAACAAVSGWVNDNFA
jgi:hypothetical protein